MIQNWDVITKTCQQITFEKRGEIYLSKKKNIVKTWMKEMVFFPQETRLPSVSQVPETVVTCPGSKK